MNLNWHLFFVSEASRAPKWTNTTSKNQHPENQGTNETFGANSRKSGEKLLLAPVGRNDKQAIGYRGTFFGPEKRFGKNRVPGTLATQHLQATAKLFFQCWNHACRRPGAGGGGGLGRNSEFTKHFFESSSLWMFMMYHEFIFQAINSKISNSPFWPNNIKKQYETREKKRQDTTQKRQKRNHLPGNSAFSWPFWDGENVTLSKVKRPPTFGDRKVTAWITWRILSTKYWLLNRDPYNGLV